MITASSWIKVAQTPTEYHFISTPSPGIGPSSGFGGNVMIPWFIVVSRLSFIPSVVQTADLSCRPRQVRFRWLSQSRFFNSLVRSLDPTHSCSEIHIVPHSDEASTFWSNVSFAISFGFVPTWVSMFSVAFLPCFLLSTQIRSMFLSLLQPSLGSGSNKCCLSSI